MPRKSLETTDSQLQLPSFVEVVQLGQHPLASGETRITLGRLITLAGETASVDPEPEAKDFTQAMPATIEKGLYIPYSDDRYETAQQLVRLGSGPGVVFPSYEYQTVARNPRDLARHIESQTRKANIDNPNRDEVRQKVGRAAGHALSEKISSIVSLSSQINSDKDTMRSLYKDLKSSWRAHYKSKNLEKKRVFADEKIHEAAEISTINLNLGSAAVEGLHRAVKKNLYGGNRTHAEIAFQWQSYIALVGMYMGARGKKLELSEAMCRQEFSRFKYFLEPEARAA